MSGEDSGDWRPDWERFQSVSVFARLGCSPGGKMNFSSDNRTEDLLVFEISDTIIVLAYAIMAVGKILVSCLGPTPTLSINNSKRIYVSFTFYGIESTFFTKLPN